jgi:hypothetical protein
MQLQGRFKYLGIEKGETREGKPYARMGILQGLRSEIMYPSDDILVKVSKIPVMSDVECLLNINVRDDKTAYIAILDIYPTTAK